MKTLFLVLQFVLLAFCPIGFQKLFRKKDSLSKKLLQILIPACLSLMSHIALILTHNELFAFCSYAFYFSCSLWISVMILGFSIIYTEEKVHKLIFKFLIIPLALIDSASFFVNIFIPFLFDLRIAVFDFEEYFRCSPKSIFLFHVIFSLLVLIYSFGIMLIKMLKNPPIFRIKYYSFLAFLFLIFLSNISYIILDYPFNFSALIYAFCFVGSYRVLYCSIHVKLIQKTLGLITDGLKNGIILLDTRDTCIYVNSFIKNVLNADKSDVLEKDFILDFCKRKKESGAEVDSPFSCEYEFSLNSSKVILKISDFFIKENDVIVGKYYLVEDVTESKNQIHEEKIQRTRDKLTGLYNQDYFIEKVEYRIKYDRFTPYYLIITDIVNFKLINELHGKTFGDSILLRLADSIRENAAPDDIYGRLYNDHFVMFIPKRHFNDKAFINAFVNKMSYLNNFSYTLIGHMGIYEVDDLSLPVSIMCDRAFLALRSIKNDYKNTVAYYDEKLRNEVLHMQTLMNDLPLAMKNGQVVMYLQSQTDKNGKLSGAEALVRWHHPIRGVIPPAEFIAVMERINIISEVDRFIWECACKKLTDWKSEGRGDLTISVNISAKDFFTMDLYETFTDLVKKYDISPKMLNLEITETALIFDLENQMKLIERLRLAGFIIEMDDFGCGYSSLNMLNDISVDVLKIDMGFLCKFKNDKKSRLILKEIIKLAKELDLKVITEGVESAAQVEFLSEAGCDLFQGFYFSRPIPVDDFEDKYFN